MNLHEKIDDLEDPKINSRVIKNFSQVKFSHTIPAFIIFIILFFLVYFYGDGFTLTDKYINIQRPAFLTINHFLCQLPTLETNLTQLGDVVFIFAILTILILYTPKIWEALLISALLSVVVSAVLKKIFSVPRPASMVDHDTFTIIGKTISGNSSLPSGHSIIVFIVITILIYAFLPLKNRFWWCLLMLFIGSILATSRVAVGAHYPLDVIAGSCIGYILGIVAIKISGKISYFSWISNIKFYPYMILVLLAWIVFIISEIFKFQLFISFFALAFLILTTILMIRSYAKKKN